MFIAALVIITIKGEQPKWAHQLDQLISKMCIHRMEYYLEIKKKYWYMLQHG